MLPLKRWEMALRLLTAFFTLVAAGALLWRPPVPGREIPPAGLGAPLAPQRPSVTDPTTAQTIAEANIFSPSRAAPRERYDPFEPPLGGDASLTPEPTGGEPWMLTEEDVVPRLFGTVAGPQGALALLRLEPGTAGARLYREGDVGGRYRVERIEGRLVVLSGPQGRVVLRLGRPEGPPP